MALTALLTCTPVIGLAANADDPVNFVLGTAVRYEDNLFRLSPGTNPVAVLGTSQKSDWVTTSYAGVRIDKPYSLQRFQLAATATMYRYNTFDYLDFIANDYRGAWLWSVTPRLTGTLSSEQREAASSFNDFRNFGASNVRKTQLHRLTADWWVGGPWHAVGGAYHTKVRNSSTFTQDADFSLDAVEAGIRFVSRADNSIAIVHRRGDGEYLNRTANPVTFIDDAFDENETQARLRWDITGKSTLNGYVGHVERNHQNFSERDFRGAVGQLVYLWTPTGKLRVTLEVGRDLRVYQEAQNSYFVSNYVVFNPVWLATARTSVGLRLDYNTRDFRGPVVPTPVLREDTIKSVRLHADWAPTRTVTVGTFIQHDQRNSNFAAFEYDSNTVGFSANLRF